MKKIILALCILFLASTSFAQEVVSSGGNTQQNSDYEVSWTVGEPVISTLAAGSSILTQGFHQSKLVITPIDDFSDSRNRVSFFPNPVHQFAVVRFSQIPEKKSYKIFDLSGKLLESKKLDAINTKIDLTHFSNGSYLLKIIHQEHQPLQTFKIIKQ